jgi:mono/diheme cytochrome c family protein
MTSAFVRAGLAGVAVLALAGAAGAAGEAEMAKRTYVQYCGACHGADGKGDGIAGTFMRPKPIDLTQIAKQNHGKFPFEKVMHTIDGRETVRAHGTRDMPVWGEIFDAEAVPATARGEVQAKIMAITTHVQSIQQP